MTDLSNINRKDFVAIDIGNSNKHEVNFSTNKKEFKPPQDLNSKVKFFMKWAGLDLLVTTTTLAANVALTSANICGHQYMPDWLANFTNNTNYPHYLIRETLVPNNPLLKAAVVAPFTEEIHYRLIIQELLLKQLPKKLISHVSPKHADLVDSKVAKYARVFLSSLIFALPHYICPENAMHMLGVKDKTIACVLSNRVINAFGGGLILGALQETTGSLEYPLIAHMLHNFIPALSFPNQ